MFYFSKWIFTADDAEFKIRKQIIENHLVESIIILPREMFYTTDISVTIWLIKKNKKEKKSKLVDDNVLLRNTENEVLFMDLRQKGIPFEKKYKQFSIESIQEFVETYNTWKIKNKFKLYKNIPEYCYSANLDEIREKDYSLVPSQYIEFVNKDEKINFNDEMKSLKKELKTINDEDIKSKKELTKLLTEIDNEKEI